MGIEHLTRIMNKDTERGFTAHAHDHRLLSQFNHWPQEALESDPLKLPTLRILRLASNIPGLEYDHMPPLHQDNHITDSFTPTIGMIEFPRDFVRRNPAFFRLIPYTPVPPTAIDASGPRRPRPTIYELLKRNIAGLHSYLPPRGGA